MLEQYLLKTTFAQNNIFSKKHLFKTTLAQNNMGSNQHFLKTTFAEKHLFKTNFAQNNISTLFSEAVRGGPLPAQAVCVGPPHLPQGLNVP